MSAFNFYYGQGQPHRGDGARLRLSQPGPLVHQEHEAARQHQLPVPLGDLQRVELAHLLRTPASAGGLGFTNDLASPDFGKWNGVGDRPAHRFSSRSGSSSDDAVSRGAGAPAPVAGRQPASLVHHGLLALGFLLAIAAGVHAQAADLPPRARQPFHRRRRRAPGGIAGRGRSHLPRRAARRRRARLRPPQPRHRAAAARPARRGGRRVPSRQRARSGLRPAAPARRVQPDRARPSGRRPGRSRAGGPADAARSRGAICNSPTPASGPGASRAWPRPIARSLRSRRTIPSTRSASARPTCGCRRTRISASAPSIPSRRGSARRWARSTSPRASRSAPAWRSKRRRPAIRGWPRCTSPLPSSPPMTDDGTTPLARSRSSSPCSRPAARRWRCGRASTRRDPRGGRDPAMSAWLLRAVACGFLLAAPAIGAAQEQPPQQPPHAGLEALAGVARPRPRRPAPGPASSIARSPRRTGRAPSSCLPKPSSARRDRRRCSSRLPASSSPTGGR